MTNPAYKKLSDRLRELALLWSTMSTLHWDEEVMMPPKGAAWRSKMLGRLSAQSHEEFLAINEDGLLTRLVAWAKAHPTEPEAAAVRDVWRSYRNEKRLPTAFVRTMTETCSTAHPIWVEARQKSDFKRFLPHLKKVVALKRREADYLGFKESPYDALLDTYEPGMTSRQVEVLFAELRDFLTGFIPRILEKQRVRPLTHEAISTDEQRAVSLAVAEAMGFDFAAGRLDVSAHPFTIHMHTQDVRITTRYDKTDLFSGLGSTMHEVGHALYEQGLPAAQFGTPLGEAISLGIHESQSRIWENMIGKSKAFCSHLLPDLQVRFPSAFRPWSLDDFYRSVNAVDLSLIRVESDEVTYNLHIIVRYEIEKALIEGKLKVEEIPTVWRKKMKTYFGIDVPDDAHGCLQDVHWSGGSIGYFPTYTLGNLYSAQLYAAAKKQMPTLETEVSHGHLTLFRDWLRKNVHRYGKRYTAAELIERVTGEPLSSRYFIEYLREKYEGLM